MSSALYCVLSVLLCVLFVCKCVLQPGDNSIAVNKYIIYHIILCHIISCHIISCHIICHIISYHIISYHIISYHIISYHIISYHIISYHIISYHIIYLIYAAVEAYSQELIEKFKWTHHRNAHTYTRKYVENMTVFQVSTFTFLEEETSKCKTGLAAAFLDKDCRTVR